MSIEHDQAPLVTVYITSYNYERYIRQAIESVLAQTLQDFELIVIDDGSTDNSRAIIEAYAVHPKILPIFQQNKGLNVTNNIALRVARGRYIMRLDADDWLDPHAIEVLSNVLERHPNVGLVFPDYYLVDQEGHVTEQVRRHDFDDVTLLDQPAHGACTMIRCDCLREVGGYDESFRCQDGYDLWIRFIEHFEVQNVNLPLFFYRQHGNNLTRNEENILATRSEIVRRMAERKGSPLNVLAVIAVRGPSIDPASPALKPLGGKPLLDWTLQAACEARRIRQVIVSTPDHALIEYVRKFPGHTPLAVERPAALATPNTPLIATLRHALEVAEASGEHFDAVFQLSIESPFRAARHLNAAIEVMELFDTDVVIGVRPETDNFYRHNGHGLVAVSEANRLRLEREEIYREVGSMRLLRREQVLTDQAQPKARVGNVILDQRAAVRLVSYFDWAVAELLTAAQSESGAARQLLFP
ncbi:MAG: glycosyltransferase [Nitrospirota bacterium]|nr:glycosyltransferase [Nitrospirota bacterium]